MPNLPLCVSNGYVCMTRNLTPIPLTPTDTKKIAIEHMANRVLLVTAQTSPLLLYIHPQHVYAGHYAKRFSQEYMYY